MVGFRPFILYRERRFVSRVLHLSLKFRDKTSSLPASPTGTLRRELPIPRPLFYIFLRVPNKQDLLIKQSHISLKVPGKAAASPWSPNGREMPVSRAFPYIFFRTPSKGALLTEFP